MKEKVSVTFRRAASGEVFGEIINEEGVTIACRNFGIMTEAEFRDTLKRIEEEFPDISSLQIIELQGN